MQVRRTKLKLLLVLLLLCLLCGELWCSSREPELMEEYRLAKASSDAYGTCSTLINLGDYYYLQNRLEEARQSFESAYEIALKHDYDTDQVYIEVNLGNILDLTSDLKAALKYYNLALSKAQNSASSRYLPQIHNNMGNLYLKVGSFAESLKHYQRALHIRQMQKDPNGLANALRNLSIYYLKTGDYTRSLEYQFEALEKKQEVGDESEIAAILSSISVIYRNMEDYPNALVYNRKAIDLYRKLNNKSKLASSYNNLGVLHLARGDLHQALDSYLLAYNMKSDSQDQQSILASLVNLADISMKLGRFQKAGEYLKAAEEIKQRTQYYELSRLFYKLYAEYYEVLGKHRDALHYFKAYHSISDSLQSLENSRQLNELEVKYELGEKERNIELLKRNNELSMQELKTSRRLRNYLFIIILLVLLITLILIWRYRSVLLISKQLQTSKDNLNSLNLKLEQRVIEEVDKRRAQEHRALRQSRLALLGELAAGISHELNQPMQTLSLTLENIKDAIADKDLDAEYLERKLGYLFGDIQRMQEVIDHIRRFSRPTDDTQDLRFDAITGIRNAVNLVKERFEKNSLLIELKECQAPCLTRGNAIKFEHVILNLLTNARDAIQSNISDGVIQQGWIRISSVRVGSSLEISVEDNGCGIPAQFQQKVFDLFFSTKSADQGTGLGLAISLGTLKAMGASISFSSDPPHGTCFKLIIPLCETQQADSSNESQDPQKDYS